MEPFSIARLPRIEFGRGKFSLVPGIAKKYGTTALLVTGARSFLESPAFPPFMEGIEQNGIKLHQCRIEHEPSPGMVDEIAAEFRDANIDVVIGVGGGSVLDAAKAISGLLKISNSVMDFLEGVGPELPYPGPACSFIAVPTTAGTGSEATKNAVLSVQGPDGFKKSFRDDQLVPEYAVVDSDLLSTCPAEQIAANGMDALTQLMESYVSTRSNPLTDTLALNGLSAIRDSLLAWYAQSNEVKDARDKMAYAAMLSGITLAQTGLGSVHGLASPLGAFFPIPHGVACGSTVAMATQINVDAMRNREPDNPALDKYANVGRLMYQRHFDEQSDALEALIEMLSSWTRVMQLPGLSNFGVSENDIPKIVANSQGNSMKTNPIVLTDEEIGSLVRHCL